MNELPKVVSFSGGRSSAYLVMRLWREDAIAASDQIIFCNTGKEMPATLDFVNEVDKRVNRRVVWLEYTYRDEKPRHHYKVVNYETASRDGRPFKELLSKQMMLPNVARRLCTAELKVKTINRYMNRQLGVKDYVNVLGLRADEQRRVANIERSTELNIIYPMVKWGLTKEQVLLYWAMSDFDLALDKYGGYGNCDLCFMKRRGTLIQLIKEQPELANWWIEQEEAMRQKRVARGQPDNTNNEFIRELPYKTLKIIATSQRGFEGEGWGIMEEAIDCFCTD